MMEINDDERARILRIVDENKAGDYWKILSEYVNEWRNDEVNLQMKLTVNGIKKEDVERYNASLERMELCDRFLFINQEITEMHLDFITRAKKLARHISRRLGSFVGMNLSGNGQK